MNTAPRTVRIAAPRTPGARAVRTAAIAVAAAVVAVGTAVALSGCSAVTDSLQKVHQETFPTTTAAESGWQGVAMPAWIPDGATEIRNLATNDEIAAVIRVTTDAELPADCAEGERKTVPFDGRDWTPDLEVLPDTVTWCGEYEVIALDDGYLGWFNGTEAGDRPDQ